MPAFPFFIDIESCSCLIVGGGRVALRKLKTLMAFSSRITVVAPEICSEIKRYDVQVIEREFISSDIDGRFMVIAATDNKILNHLVSMLCREEDILVNSATNADDCDFYFPSVISEGDMTIGISSKGTSPLASKIIRKRIAEALPDNMGVISERLAEYRDIIKESVPKEQRKRVSLEISEILLEKADIADDEVMRMIRNNSKTV